MKRTSESSHQKYIQVLRAMGPERRLNRACELSDMAKALFRHGLRIRYPHLTEEELQKKYLERLEKCHNRNW